MKSIPRSNPRCPHCEVPTRPTTPEAQVTVAGVIYSGPVAARACPQCNYEIPPELRGFRLRAARDIVMNGSLPDKRGEVFEFLRTALGYERKVLGEMLGHTSETLLGWEMGAEPVPPAVMAVMGRLVLDNLDPEHASMVRLLRAARFPDPNLKPGARFKV